MTSGPTSPPWVEVIVPTLCEGHRRESLLRAVDSVRRQDGVRATLILVVNGEVFDAGLLAELRAHPDTRVLQRSEGHLPKAIRAGRENVKAPFFCFLDDDDYLLPRALCERLAPLLADAAIDAVVGNGYKAAAGHRNVQNPDMAAVAADPADTLISLGWLTSCGGLYRSCAIGPDLFDPTVQYLEWTYLAFRLALTKKLAFVTEPLHVINETSESLSTSKQYRRTIPVVLDRLLELEMPAALKYKLRRKRTRAYHDLAEFYRVEGQLWHAWRCHLRSLDNVRGLSANGLYTRHLLGTTLARCFGGGR